MSGEIAKKAQSVSGAQATQMDYILLDGSGSMSEKWWDTIAGLDNFLNCLKAQNIHSHGILHVFDSTDIELIQRDGLIGEWKGFREEPIGLHGGGTPLYDAVNIMVRKLADLDPPRASIVIITDGHETSSRATTLAQAKNLLDWCRAKGWQVTFLGADFSNSAQAKALGATERNSIGVAKSRLSDAGKLLGEKRVRNALSGADINFSESEQEDFGGYLTHDPSTPWKR